MMKPERAEAVALNCLTWLIGNDELRDVFMGAAGLSEAELRRRAGDPELLASVLDFILMDDAWVVACCDGNSWSYETVMQARTALPGGVQVHWT
jgi:hypothetical protein|tara:strand:- start:6319 stop:6600 length:282 start_codon:yes stop_codon:yes gene_type:complete